MTAYNVVSRAALQSGEDEDISVVLANFDAIAAVVNGSLDNSNLASAAGILLSKLAQSGASTGQLARWSGTVWEPWTLPATIVPVGTSLPGTPTDGDEYILVDSDEAPTYAWHFRYVSGFSDSYKWAFVGGAAAAVYVQEGTEETTTSTSYAALSTAGPSFAIPRAGIYSVEIGGYFDNLNGSTDTFMSYDIGGTGAVDADACNNVQGTIKDWIYRKRTKTLTAVTLTAKYRVTGGTGRYQSRAMRVTPIRVA